MAAQFGLRLRKGAATTALAAATVAALAASQAPGVTTDSAGRQAAGAPSPEMSTLADDTASGNSRYYTDLPPLDSPNPTTGTGDTSGTTGGSERGIPATVLDAYKKAEASLRESKPGCNLPWQLLAAIGKVESGQASGGRVDAEGTTIGKKILGPPLNGNGFANISDTDNGAYDDDTTHDRAVGPMQFIPSTWEWAGRDGNDDGAKDPNNVYDAALAAGHYLCRFDWDLSNDANLRSAILSYNNSTEYYNTVMTWLEYYRKGTHEIPDGTGSLPETPSGGNSNNTGNGNGGNGNGNGNSTPNPSPTPPKTDKPSTEEPAGGGTTTPPPPATTPPSTPATPTDTVHHLENAGAANLTAMAGDTFTGKLAARTETKAGKAVAKVRVRFTIAGDTDTTFTGGEKVATVITNSVGKATAPALVAGEKTGAVTVRATVVGRSVTALEHKVTVTARRADALARTGTTALTCVPNGEFAEQVEVKATYRGEVADKVAVKATLVKSLVDLTENDKGPYFQGADGKPVRTLALETGTDGLLKLPKLYSDDATGTFLLHVETEGGATLTLELKVEAPAESAEPTETAEPVTPSPSES
ncbi:lytic transglycosylase domain-containing protein [Streptomyces europaeiscabiei]|uniref:lytic transglycosylase domain-containing protein n=1 Tax=Streptomyces europaeiscabiei TaxID=146819 RepID=UPI0029A72AC8|nr:lytic transglycosylase domain-containing protein [Streptomyces europaeiscabiei]MDX3633055.1 lytic transglycosylase domain-containing protein [Streptomyces europaeiscabiei]MDX3650436.1 lytic transglycosylase domain-containing protein [Streptomyces europaeiscabiei]